MNFVKTIHGRFQALCFAVMTDHFVPQVGHSVLNPMIKYQTMSLKVSNACGFEQATAYISLLTLQSSITKQHLHFHFPF